MEFLVKTIVGYIKDDINKAANKDGIWRYVLSSYPPKVLLKIGEEINEFLEQDYGSDVRFEYGIAYKLGEKWAAAPQARAVFEEIKAKGWYNAGNNLTELRNRPKPPGVSKMIIILAGYEEIDDQDSLGDFFRLDSSNVWKLAMNSSFECWLKKEISAPLNKEEFKEIDAVFCWIYQNYYSDLCGISSFLEELGLKQYGNKDSLYERLAEGLRKSLGLPNLIGALRKKSKNFASYAQEGLDFFKYKRFKNPTGRKRQLDKIEKLQQDKSKLKEPEDWQRGCYQNSDEILEDLKAYIDHNDQSAAAKLRTVDFVYICDKVLKLRLKGQPKPDKPAVKKLKGLPPEVFLRALLLTIAEYKKEVGENGASLPPALQITIESKAFRHNFYTDTDTYETGETGAKRFLIRVLGGIDAYLKDHLVVFADNDASEVRLEYDPSREGIVFKETKNADPYLEFEVKVKGEGDSEAVITRYRWMLPENHPSYLVHELTEWLLQEYNSRNEAFLPLFGIWYFNEMFRARGEESVVRIFRQGLKKERQVRNLLEKLSPESNQLPNLAHTYYEFWKSVNGQGVFKALDAEFDKLRKAHEAAAEECLKLKEDGDNSLYLLMKAFLVTDVETTNSKDIEWEKRLAAAAVTLLHPALLELAKNQYTYLGRAFNYLVRNRLNSRSLMREWGRVVDLAGIKRPLFGILGDNSSLITEMRSCDYIHLLGSPTEVSDFIDSRLLLDYDTDEDDELSEEVLFEQSQTSLLIEDLLMRYVCNHPFAHDGMSITVYCGNMIQSIIAGIDGFLRELAKKRDEAPPFALQLNLFSDAESDTEAMKWINAWKDRWYQEETGGRRHYYANCEITIRFRIVSSDKTAEDLKNLLKETPSDVVILCDIVHDDDSEFRTIEKAEFKDYLMFPVLEKVVCQRKQIPSYKRQRIISNQRFNLPLRHAEMLYAAKTDHPIPSPTKTCLVFATSSLDQFAEAVNAAHESGNWVICLDEAIDKGLLLDIACGGTRREIVGFGTGIGSHGEINYTVSTDKYWKTTIIEKLTKDIEKVLGDLDLDKERRKRVAEVLIEAADEITGMSLVNITGVPRFVHEFIGNAMIRKMLARDQKAFCDELICLDDFPHWFNFENSSTESSLRPDLLRLLVEIREGYVNITAQVIECKVVQDSEEHLEKARQQIRKGLSDLISLFVPRIARRPLGSDYDTPPERRYWWMQLHRLIASKSKVDDNKYLHEALRALERLSEGYFNIRWQAAAFVFRTDVKGKAVEVDNANKDWLFEFDEIPELGKLKLQAALVKASRDFIPAFCLENQATGFDDPFEKAGRIEIKCVKEEKEAEEVAIVEPTDSIDESDPYKSGGSEEQINTGRDMAAENQGEPYSCKTKDQAPSSVTASSYPERAFLGIHPDTQKPVYWEFGHPELSNRHLLVFGASGQGKTYAIQAILLELAKGGQNSLIIDYTDGFTDQQLDQSTKEKLKPKQHYVKKEPLPINIFRSQNYFIDGQEFTDQPNEIAYRVSGVFSSIYSLGDVQKGILYEAITEGVIEKGLDFTLEDLVKILERIREAGGPKSTSAAPVISKIKPFVDTKPFGKEDPQSWERLFTDPVNRCHIVQLAGYNSRETTRLITEFTLLDLYRYYRAYGSVKSPRVIVLDEAQNLDHSLESPIGQLLTEGRKFGLSLILATQTLSNLSKDEKDRLFQAKHKLYFRPADTELNSFAKIIADSLNQRTEEWVQRLASLKRGECYSVGPSLDENTGKLIENSCFKIRIASLAER